MTDQARARMRSMLRDDVTKGKLQWYYISITGPTAEFLGGLLIEARGPTEAWTLMHRLGLYPEDSNAATNTNGPIPDEVMAKVPVEMRWRELTLTEVENLGK